MASLDKNTTHHALATIDGAGQINIQPGEKVYRIDVYWMCRQTDSTLAEFGEEVHWQYFIKVRREGDAIRYTDNLRQWHAHKLGKNFYNVTAEIHLDAANELPNGSGHISWGCSVGRNCRIPYA